MDVEKTNELHAFRAGSFAIGFFLGAVLMGLLWQNWNMAFENGKVEVIKVLKARGLDNSVGNDN